MEANKTWARGVSGAVLGAMLALGVGAGCRLRPSTLTLRWDQNMAQYRGQTGRVFSVVCPPGGSPSGVWGTDLYSDDSSVCSAAVHAGRASFAMGGAFQVQLAPGAPSYAGSIRGGITSNNYGSWAGSFTIVGGAMPGLVAMPLSVIPTAPTLPVPTVNFMPGVPTAVSWNTDAASLRGRVGQMFTAVCPPGGAVETIWGTDLYSDDSSICSAAAHAGRLAAATGGTVAFWVQPGAVSYSGSVRNGVTSVDYGTWQGSFSFTPTMPVQAAVAPPGATAITWASNGTQYRGQLGTVQTLFCPPGSALGSAWGSGPYTDDSSICTAAVHAGVFPMATGGVLHLTPLPGLPVYPPSSRNGVTTNQYARFVGSFAVTP